MIKLLLFFILNLQNVCSEGSVICREVIVWIAELTVMTNLIITASPVYFSNYSLQRLITACCKWRELCRDACSWYLQLIFPRKHISMIYQYDCACMCWKEVNLQGMLDKLEIQRGIIMHFIPFKRNLNLTCTERD